MRLVFCGTPQFAIPTLQQLLAAGHTIELVVTQPDRVRGRDQDASPPPVKLLAAEAGLPVVQPEKILTFALALERSSRTPSSLSPTAASFRNGC
jgi:methionyl-tRNA formyltransferase